MYGNGGKTSSNLVVIKPWKVGQNDIEFGGKLGMEGWAKCHRNIPEFGGKLAMEGWTN